MRSVLLAAVAATLALSLPAKAEDVRHVDSPVVGANAQLIWFAT